MANPRNSVVIDLRVRGKQATQVLKGIEGGFSRLEKASSKSTSMVRRSSQAMTQGFSRASQQVQGSTVAVSNLSRIVEDAPFGIRGVANNINPFIQSFQQLSKQTGSTTTAMKTLLTSAFTGPGALLTISALVTSTMTAIQMGLFDMGEEAKEVEAELQGVLDGIDRIIELRDQFGEFEDDELGISEQTARLEQIEISLREQRSALNQIESLQEKRASVEREIQAGNELTRALLAGQLDEIDQQISRIGEQEEIEKNIRDLQVEREEIASKLASTSDALSKDSVQQARAAQQTREEKERQLELEREIQKARQSVEMQRGEDVVFGADIDTTLPSGAGGGMQATPGSIADLEARIRALSEFRKHLDPASKGFQTLTERIEESKNELSAMKDEGKESVEQTSRAADILGQSLAQAVIHGENLGSVLENLAAQLASRALINGLSMLLSGGAFSIGGLFGFAHGTDMGFPGIGMVGEDGPEMAVAPPFSSIITNENIERLERLRGEAAGGAAAMMGMGGGIDPGMIEQAIIKGMSRANVNISVDPVDQALDEFRQLKGRVGN